MALSRVVVPKSNLSYPQTDATTPNIAALRTNVAKRLTGFKLCRTTPNNTQQHSTTCNRVCKGTQHVTSNNVGSCWPTMLRPFAQGFRSRIFCYGPH